MVLTGISKKFPVSSVNTKSITEAAIGAKNHACLMDKWAVAIFSPISKKTQTETMARISHEG